MSNHKYYTTEQLNTFLEKTKIPSDSFYFRSLEIMVKTGSIKNLNNLIELINYLKKNTPFRGISCLQAVELSKNYIYYQEKDLIKIQHLICGLIIDWWNLEYYSQEIGAISCYYDKRNDSKKLIKKYPIKLPNAFDDNQYNNYNYKFWLNHSRFN